MMSPLEPTEDLRFGRRALDTVEGCYILADFRWFESRGVWALHVRLSPPGLSSTALVPSSTNWFLTVDRQYPAGSVGLYPAKEGGLTGTFWHQVWNGPGLEDEPWRTGNICTQTILWTFHRHGLDEEPRSAGERIRWHVLRGLAWLIAAASGALIQAGDHYELPLYPRSPDIGTVIGFAESQETFRTWKDIAAPAGLVHLVRHPRNERLSVTRRFSTCEGLTLLDVQWGSELSGSGDEDVGLWIRLEKTPALPPWQPPTSWEELWQAIRLSGTHPSALLHLIPKRF